MPPTIHDLPWPPHVAVRLHELTADTESLDDLTGGQIDALRVVARDLPAEIALVQLKAISEASLKARDFAGAFTATSAMAHYVNAYAGVEAGEA